MEYKNIYSEITSGKENAIVKVIEETEMDGWKFHFAIPVEFSQKPFTKSTTATKFLLFFRREEP